MTATSAPTVLMSIDAPYGALAQHDQQYVTRIVEYPPTLRPAQASAKSTDAVPVPSKASAQWFQDLFDGYLAANFVCAPCTRLELQRVREAEEQELCDARSGIVVDATLPPRHLAIWLRVSATRLTQNSRLQLLDAFTQWTTDTNAGQPVVWSVRPTFVVEEIDDNGKDALVEVRWWESVQDASSVRCVSREVEVTLDAVATIARVQQACVALLTAHAETAPAIDLWASVARPIALSNPPPTYADAFARLVRAFRSKTDSPPSITLSTLMMECKDIGPLEKTDVIVRLTPRGADGTVDVANPAAFHGILLSLGSERERARFFAGPVGAAIGAPAGIQEERMGLHVCAIHTDQAFLDATVSAYGMRGVPAAPLHPPRSWVWRENVAILPIDGSQNGVLRKFDCRVCGKDAVLPRRPELREPYKKHLNRVEVLFAQYMKEQRPTHPAYPTHSSPTSVLTHLSQQTTLDHDVDTGIRLMWHIDPASERTRIGDALVYAQAQTRGQTDAAIRPSASLLTLLATAAASLGCDASLADATRLAARALARDVPPRDPASMSVCTIGEGRRACAPTELRNTDRVVATILDCHGLAVVPPLHLPLDDRFDRAVIDKCVGAILGVLAAVVCLDDRAALAAAEHALTPALTATLVETTAATAAHDPLIEAICNAFYVLALTADDPEGPHHPLFLITFRLYKRKTRLDLSEIVAPGRAVPTSAARLLDADQPRVVLLKQRRGAVDLMGTKPYNVYQSSP